MSDTAVLSDAEMAFLTALIVEGFHLDDPEHPACEALRNLGITPDHGAKIFEFKYLWQEQGRYEGRYAIFDSETGKTIIAPLAPCPWPDAETFLRRWREILPEIVARGFEKNHNPEHHRRLIGVRPEIWGEVEVNTFTSEEAEFLDAWADEVRSRSLGPCFRALVARNIHHFHALGLVERRWFELTEQGISWPRPHLPDPPCPWPDRQAFADRFDREIHPHLYYSRKESWEARTRPSPPGPGATECDHPAK